MIEIRHKDTLEDLRAGYDQLYSETSIALHRMEYRWILDRLEPEPGSRILDVACGEGILLREVLRRKSEVWGVDFSATAIHQAQHNIPSGRFSVANGEVLPYADNSFDYVTNIGSLEHYEHMEYGSQEMARVLKPNGRALILLPNLFGLLWNIPHVKATGDIYDDGQPIQRYASPAEWRRLLENNGFVVEAMFPFGVWPKTLSEVWHYLWRPKLWLIVFVWQPRQFPNLANCLVYRCCKR